MKMKLLAVMENIKDDAKFWIRFFTPEGRFSCERRDKAFVLDILGKAVVVSENETFNDVLMFNETIGVSRSGFNENVIFETPNTDGFKEYASKHNSNYKVYLKLDKEAKTITFKLGNKVKMLELIEHSVYAHRPYKGKYMEVASVESLEKFINDPFWNPAMVPIGRKVLNIKDVA